MIETNQHPFYIPPLNLTPKTESKAALERILFNRKADPHRQRSSTNLLKTNSDFIKEKYLYRYYISKNKGSLPSPKTGPLEKNQEKEQKKQEEGHRNLERFFASQEPNKFTNTLSQPTRANIPEKQKYFKRKTQVNRTQFYSAKIKTQQNIIDKEESQQEKQWLELLNSEMDNNLFKVNQQIHFQDFPNNEKEISQLKQINKLIQLENNELRKKLTEKQEKIQQLSKNIKFLEDSKHQLQIELQKNNVKINLHFKQQTSLLEQLELKEKIIQKWQNGYKYIEIENLVLNHAKSQCCQQKSVIEHLEKEKKMLEQKIKLFYSISKKGNKRVRLSETSEISLNFSMEKEDIDNAEELFSTFEMNEKQSRQPWQELSERVCYNFSK